MKKTTLFLISIIFLSGCTIGGYEINIKKIQEKEELTDPLNLFNDNSAPIIEGATPDDPLNILEDEKDFPYSQLSDLVPVYNKFDKLSGYLVRGMSNECGSDCAVYTFFIKQSDGDLKIEKIDELDSNTFGGLYEENKNLYKSEFIWGEGESHFGCHRYKFEKLKFIDNQFVTVEERVTVNRYTVDVPDPQDQCIRFPGAKNVMTAEKLFE